MTDNIYEYLCMTASLYSPVSFKLDSSLENQCIFFLYVRDILTALLLFQHCKSHC